MLTRYLQVMVSHATYDGFVRGPLGSRKQVRPQVAAMLHGFSNETLDYIVNNLYDDDALASLEQSSEGPSGIELDDFDPPLLDGVNMMSEILVGCNTRALANAFKENMTNGFMNEVEGDALFALLGIPSEESNRNFIQEVFLDFVDKSQLWFVEGRRVFKTAAGAEGGGPTHLVGVQSADGLTVVEDMHDNDRCAWWIKEGYEKWQAESKFSLKV
jgi:hypothetical protein